jgi:isoleucyl-tRNA synthetase
VKGEDLRFAERGVELVLRQVLIPLWNAHSFFLTYAHIYQWVPGDESTQLQSIIDQWIIAQLHQVIHEVESGMDAYDLSRAVGPFVGFIDQLTNWYIRRSRRRFWSEQDSPDRREAFATLHHVLLELCKIAAPFIPFMSEAIYCNLRLPSMPDSVHLCDYPLYRPEVREERLEEGMAMLQLAVKLGHALRKEHKLKVRQPLPTAHVVVADSPMLAFLQDQRHLIGEELNVKQVSFHQESPDFVLLSIKPNFRVLGKKVGARMKAVQEAIQRLNQQEITTFLQEGVLSIQVEGEEMILQAEDADITRQVQADLVAMNEGRVTVALDTTLTEELLLEGIARELVNKINTMRREESFAVIDRVRVTLDTSPRVKEAVALFGEYIKGEVLALEIAYAATQGSTQWDINGEMTSIYIQKAPA